MNAHCPSEVEVFGDADSPEEDAVLPGCSDPQRYYKVGERGRIPDSQSSEPGFESPPLLPFWRLGILVHSIDAPVDSAV